MIKYELGEPTTFSKTEYKTDVNLKHNIPVINFIIVFKGF